MLLGTLSSVTGCVRVYQPMSGLHDPMVVDPTKPNFNDVSLKTRCVSGGLLKPAEASALCSKVQSLFENQGAKVELLSAGGFIGPEVPDLPGLGTEAERTELSMEITARRLHENNSTVLWILNVMSFTLVPAVTETSFSQEVVIRDSKGFILVEEELEGRLTRYFGAGSWVGNKLLDLTTRDEEDKLTGEVFGEDLSGDLYGQLSQLLFNAKIRADVLHNATHQGASR